MLTIPGPWPFPIPKEVWALPVKPFSVYLLPVFLSHSLIVSLPTLMLTPKWNVLNI